MKTVKITITLEVRTANSNESIEKALTRGIYRALDCSPYYIAQPKDVKNINIIQENENNN